MLRVIEEKQLRRVLRILLIVYKFGGNNHFIDSELRLQKIEFFFRNPDHFAYFLLNRFDKKELSIPIEELKKIIIKLMQMDELEIRIDSMRRFRYGAFEELDKTLSILSSLLFMEIDKKENHLKCTITELGIQYLKELEKEKELNWYFERIDLLYKFLEKLLPTALKNYQYLSKVYAATEWNYCIPNEINGVKKMYKKLFNEELLYEGE
ncbi:hypothetical protein [Fusobacterium varium]|uniref:hypothetical protein n=1 Tax=Fusobacterium varium TaxID=856 RepID=UPI00302B67C3